MGYAQGPLLLQSSGNVGISTSDYNFAGDVADQLGELDTIPAGWDAFLQDAGILLDQPADPFPDFDVNGAIDLLNAYGDPVAELGINALVDALGVADIAFSQAIGYAPAEAWSDPSSPFVPPAPAETIAIPVIPPGALSFSVVGTVAASANATISSPPLVGVGGGTTPVGGGVPAGSGTPLPGTGAGITNTTAYGSDNYTVGDNWTLSATGGPGEQVYVYSTFNGQDAGGGPVGQIGADRTFTLSGQWGYGDVGVWQKQLYVGSTLVESANFIVLDQ